MITEEILNALKQDLEQEWTEKQIPEIFRQQFRDCVFILGRHKAAVIIAKEIEDLQNGCSLIQLCLKAVEAREESIKSIVEMNQYLEKCKGWEQMPDVQSECAELLQAYRMLSLNAVESIIKWREQHMYALLLNKTDSGQRLTQKLPFMWNDQNYFKKMQNDMNFMYESAYASAFTFDAKPDPLIVAVSKNCNVKSSKANSLNVYMEKGKAMIPMNKQLLNRIRTAEMAIFEDEYDERRSTNGSVLLKGLHGSTELDISKLQEPGRVMVEKLTNAVYRDLMNEAKVNYVLEAVREVMTKEINITVADTVYKNLFSEAQARLQQETAEKTLENEKTAQHVYAWLTGEIIEKGVQFIADDVFKDELKKIEDAEMKKRIQEEQARKLKEQEELKRKKIEEENLRKQLEEEEIKRLQEEARLKKIEDERLRKKQLEDEAMKKTLEEEERKRAEREAKLKRKEDEAIKKKMEQEEKLRLKEEARQKKLEEEEALRKKQAEEEAMKKKQAEEEAFRKKQAEEEAMKKKQEGKKKKKKGKKKKGKIGNEDEEKLAEEAMRKKLLEEEEALKKKLAEDEALRLKLEEEQEQLRKQLEEEDERKRLEEEALADKKQEEDEAERKRLEEQVEKEMRTSMLEKFTNQATQDICRNIIENYIQHESIESLAEEVLREEIAKALLKTNKEELQKALTLKEKEIENSKLADIFYSDLIDAFFNNLNFQEVAMVALENFVSLERRRTTMMPAADLNSSVVEVAEDNVMEAYTPGAHSPNVYTPNAEHSLITDRESAENTINSEQLEEPDFNFSRENLSGFEFYLQPVAVAESQLQGVLDEYYELIPRVLLDVALPIDSLLLDATKTYDPCWFFIMCENLVVGLLVYSRDLTRTGHKTIVSHLSTLNYSLYKKGINLVTSWLMANEICDEIRVQLFTDLNKNVISEIKQLYSELGFSWKAHSQISLYKKTASVMGLRRPDSTPLNNSRDLNLSYHPIHISGFTTIQVSAQEVPNRMKSCDEMWKLGNRQCLLNAILAVIGKTDQDVEFTRLVTNGLQQDVSDILEIINMTNVTST
jgi:hypothetical protein